MESKKKKKKSSDRTKNIELKNKVLIVGHQYSGFETVEKLLNASGMAEANILKQKGVNPSEISSTVLGMEPSLNDVDKFFKVKQLDDEAVWDSLISDLMESNENQYFFGWSDPKAVSLLKYWEKVDPGIYFIFVYNSPENLLVKLLNEKMYITPDILKLELEKWFQYNKILLKFYAKHKDRTLFVNAQQLFSNSKLYFEQIRQQTGMEGLKLDILIDDENHSDSSSEEKLLRHFASQVLSNFPKILDLFETIQSVANPSLVKQRKVQLSDMDVLLAFNSYKNTKNEELFKESFLFQTKENQLKKWLECKITEEKRLENHMDELEEDHLKQIFQVQENLEKNYLYKEKILQDFEQLSKEKNILDKREKILKKWLDCKKVEENRLEQNIDALRKEDKCR